MHLGLCQSEWFSRDRDREQERRKHKRTQRHLRSDVMQTIHYSNSTFDVHTLTPFHENSIIYSQTHSYVHIVFDVQLSATTNQQTTHTTFHIAYRPRRTASTDQSTPPIPSQGKPPKDPNHPASPKPPRGYVRDLLPHRVPSTTPEL